MIKVTFKQDIMHLGLRVLKPGTYTHEQIGAAVAEHACAKGLAVVVKEEPAPVEVKAPVERGNPKKAGA